MVRPRTSLSRAGWGPWIAVGLVVIAAAAAILWWVGGRSDQTQAPRPAPSPSAIAPDAGPAAVATPEQARARLEAISADPLVRRGLLEGDAIRRSAIVLDNLSEGVSPRRELAFLAPGRPFAVMDRGGRMAIAPESYQRYDGFAAAVASVDAAAAARAYQVLHPALEAAYRALGYPDASLDRVAARALRRVAGAPVRDGDVLVERSEGLFVFADPKLEELGQVEKHLLRMGPQNTRKIQAKARELLDALGLGAAPR